MKNYIFVRLLCAVAVICILCSSGVADSAETDRMEGVAEFRRELSIAYAKIPELEQEYLPLYHESLEVGYVPTHLYRVITSDPYGVPLQIIELYSLLPSGLERFENSFEYGDEWHLVVYDASLPIGGRFLHSVLGARDVKVFFEELLCWECYNLPEKDVLFSDFGMYYGYGGGGCGNGSIWFERWADGKHTQLWRTNNGKGVREKCRDIFKTLIANGTEAADDLFDTSRPQEASE